MTAHLLRLFALLIIGHVLADYPLQGDFLSRAKNRTAPIPGVPWFQAMGAHVIMHGAIVWLLTGVWWLGVAELVIHAVTDDAKCHGVLSFNQDQTIHIMCKVAWTLIVWRLYL
jgi:hypothetical protein